MSAFFALVGQSLCMKHWFRTLHTFVGMKLADVCRICKIVGDIFCLQSAGRASDTFDVLRVDVSCCWTSVAHGCRFGRWKINSEGAVAEHEGRRLQHCRRLKHVLGQKPSSSFLFTSAAPRQSSNRNRPTTITGNFFYLKWSTRIYFFM